MAGLLVLHRLVWFSSVMATFFAVCASVCVSVLIAVCLHSCVCFPDPLSMSPQKALETIGANLQKQYENWQPRVSL